MSKRIAHELALVSTIMSAKEGDRIAIVTPEEIRVITVTKIDDRNKQESEPKPLVFIDEIA